MRTNPRFLSLLAQRWGTVVTGAFMIPAVIASATNWGDPYWKLLWWFLAIVAFVWTAARLWTEEHAKVIELENRLQKIADRRQRADALGMFHERFDLLAGRINGMGAKQFDQDAEIQANFARLMVETNDFIRDKIGVAQSKIFIATYDLEQPPLSTINHDQRELVVRKQWYLALAVRSAKQIENLIKELS